MALANGMAQMIENGLNKNVMINYYYLYWVDAIISIKTKNPNRKDWKYTLFIYTTLCNALNGWVLMLWLKFFDIYSFRIEIDILSGSILSNAIGFIIYFALPFIILNYSLIFYKDRYRKLLDRYTHRNGKFAMGYIFYSVLLGFISAVIYGVIS